MNKINFFIILLFFYLLKKDICSNKNYEEFDQLLQNNSITFVLNVGTRFCGIISF